MLRIWNGGSYGQKKIHGRRQRTRMEGRSGRSTPRRRADVRKTSWSRKAGKRRSEIDLLWVNGREVDRSDMNQSAVTKSNQIWYLVLGGCRLKFDEKYRFDGDENSTGEERVMSALMRQRVLCFVKWSQPPSDRMRFCVTGDIFQ
ncbi:hypothetical protein ACLB2K_040652 [Fragaria x ananassa]